MEEQEAAQEMVDELTDDVEPAEETSQDAAAPEAAAPEEEAAPVTPSDFFHARQKRRSLLVQKDDEIASLQASNRAAMDVIEAARRATYPAAPAAPAKPPDAEEDPRGWIEHKVKEEAATQTKALQDQVDRLTMHIRNREEQAEYQNQLSARDAVMVKEIDELEGHYLSTEQGGGFGERLQAFKEWSVRNMEAVGYPPDQAAEGVDKALQGMVQRGYQMGENPVAFIDNYIGVAMGQNVPKAPAHPAADRNIAQMTEAAASGPSGTIGEGGVVKAGNPAAQIRTAIEQGANTDDIETMMTGLAGGGGRDFLDNLFLEAERAGLK